MRSADIRVHNRPRPPFYVQGCRCIRVPTGGLTAVHSRSLQEDPDVHIVILHFHCLDTPNNASSCQGSFSIYHELGPDCFCIRDMTWIHRSVSSQNLAKDGDTSQGADLVLNKLDNTPSLLALWVLFLSLSSFSMSSSACSSWPESIDIPCS